MQSGNALTSGASQDRSWSEAGEGLGPRRNVCPRIFGCIRRQPVATVGGGGSIRRRRAWHVNHTRGRSITVEQGINVCECTIILFWKSITIKYTTRHVNTGSADSCACPLRRCASFTAYYVCTRRGHVVVCNERVTPTVTYPSSYPLASRL